MIEQNQQKVYDTNKYNFKNNTLFSHKLKIAKLPVANIHCFFNNQKINQVKIFPPTSFLKNNKFYEKLTYQLKKWNQCVRKNQLPDKVFFQQKLYDFVSSRINSISFLSPTIQQKEMEKLYYWFVERNQSKMYFNNSTFKIKKKSINQKQNKLKIQREIQQVRSTFKTASPSRLFQYDHHRIALPIQIQNRLTDVQFYSKNISSFSSRQLFTNRNLFSESKERKQSKLNNKIDNVTDVESELIKSPKSINDQDCSIFVLNKKWFQKENRIVMENKEKKLREKLLIDWANKKKKLEETYLSQKQLLKQSNYRKFNFNKMKKQNNLFRKIQVLQKDTIKKNKFSQPKSSIELQQLQPTSANQLIKNHIKKQKIKQLFLRRKYFRDIIENNQIPRVQQFTGKQQLDLLNQDAMITKCQQNSLEVSVLKKEMAKNKMICSLQALTKALVNPLVLEKNIEIMRSGSTLIVNPYEKQRKISRKKKKN